MKKPTILKFSLVTLVLCLSWISNAIAGHYNQDKISIRYNNTHQQIIITYYDCVSKEWDCDDIMRRIKVKINGRTYYEFNRGNENKPWNVDVFKSGKTSNRAHDRYAIYIPIEDAWIENNIWVEAYYDYEQRTKRFKKFGSCVHLRSNKGTKSTQIRITGGTSINLNAKVISNTCIKLSWSKVLTSSRYKVSYEVFRDNEKIFETTDRFEFYDTPVYNGNHKYQVKSKIIKQNTYGTEIKRSLLSKSINANSYENEESKLIYSVVESRKKNKKQ
ncbi:MAG: hypothetical protein ACEPOZ_12255 [Marinifilaceae bacterium]